MSTSELRTVSPPTTVVDNRHSWTRWALLILLAAGLLFRLRYFAARASFWRDEAFIVLNIQDHRALDLIGPLEHGQASPPIFLFAERAMAVMFGPGEYSLRALPLVCGIAGLILFSFLARRVLRTPEALCAIAMMAFAEKLILYGAEVKQYSGDVMMGVLLLLVASIPSRSPLWRLRLASLVAAIGIWFSHTSILVFGAVGLVLIISCWRAGQRQALAAILAMLPFAISFVALDLISIRPQNTPWMRFYWMTDFPDVHDPLGVPGWVLLRLYELLGAAFPMVGPLLGIATGLGIIGLVRARKYELLGLLIGPAVVAITASLLQKYPFNSTRLTLFLLPQIFLLCGAGFEFLEETLPPHIAWVWWVLAAPIVAVGLGICVSRLIQPHFRSHIRPAVEFVRAHRQPGEAIYLTGMPALIGPDPSRGRDLELLCYWPHPPAPFHELARMKWSDVPERRFWVIFAFDPDRKNSWRDTLVTDLHESAVEQTHFIDRRGGAAYLFEHTSTARKD